jgi:hypothetical protein
MLSPIKRKKADAKERPKQSHFAKFKGLLRYLAVTVAKNE